MDDGRGSHPCLSQLDLNERAAADAGKVGGGGSHGENGVHIPATQILNRPVSIPPRYKENENLLVSPVETPLPEEPKQHHHSQVAISRAASKGRYARFRENLHVMPEATKQHQRSEAAIPCAISKQRSKAGWMSKERSTPEGIDLEKHARMFEFPLRDPPSNPSLLLEIFSGPQVVMKKRKPPEERNALRERRVTARQRVARNHAEVALRKYNRANNTKFELVEIREISIFFEFGGGCVHYNFTAKQPEDHDDSADAGSTKLFFSEVDYLSLLNRRYLGGGILTRGRRSRGHRAECTRDGGTRVTQLRNTCTMTGCCLSGIIWALARCYNGYGCASRAPGIRLI